MNTTLRGEAFENTIYDLLDRQIQEDRFWARRECCRVFRKKGYYSKDRHKEIVFDVSIEITLPDEHSPSVLVLVECKDYSTKIPVSDLEEFWAKIQQVAGANVKGIFASTAAFQEGGLRFAESRGFAVLRYFGEADFKWVLKRSASWSGYDSRAESQEVRCSLTDDSFGGSYYDCSFFVRGTYTYSSNRMFEALCLHDAAALPDLVARISNSKKQGRPTVPYIEKDDIESLAAACLNQIEYRDGPVNVALICDWQRDQRGLSVRYQAGWPRDHRTLGSLSFDPLEICLFGGAVDSGRTRFTLAHELGHIFMRHDRSMSRELTHESDLQHDSYCSLDFVDVRRMEWQANFFASCLLLPSARFAAQFFAIAQERDLRDRGFGILFVDNQPVNLANFFAVTNNLSHVFNVSRQATIIRLKEFGYLNDVRHKSDLQPLSALGDDV